MEGGTVQRFRSRKRYCCFYCNTYFYQVDAWQRHNRKHTGVEIECDDCGEMFSDHIDLKSHQPNCQAHHMYTEDVFTDNLPKVVSKEHETPDSTSKQDINGIDDSNTRPKEEVDAPAESNDTTEFDDLIGEVEEAKDSTSTSEEVDPATEAMIGIDHSAQLVVDTNNNEQEKSVDDQLKSENSIVLGEAKNLLNLKTQTITCHGVMNNSCQPISDQISPSGSSNAENHQPLLDHATDINKKYQPYFCKNCGARFTRKDSVTRHLKKGTCSGKTAIVCNVCGKIFPDVLELQRHFKLEHKNMSIPPPMVARSILPRVSENHDTPRFQSYPYLPAENRHSRSYVNSHDPHYHPPSLQPVYYSNQPHHSTAYHNREHYFPAKNMKSMRTQMNGPCKRDPLFIDIHRTSEISHYKDEVRSSLKREFDFHENGSDRYYRKSHKTDADHALACRRYDEPYFTKNINLSEYTNNAMSSKQYYDNRFSSHEHAHRSQVPLNVSKDDAHAHRCKVCGLEFPRFEYLLTHLRKHKDVERTSEFDDVRAKGKDESLLPEQTNRANGISVPKGHDTNSIAPVTSAADVNEHGQGVSSCITIASPSFSCQSLVSSTMSTGCHTSAVVSHTNSVSGCYTSHQEQLNIISQQQPKPQESYNGIVGNAFDGKFRPFICENCGQRFTRKDSLVRHAKKQTCYEELVDLKCKHCEKSFRYSKCLTQHQELVHGIPPPIGEKQCASEDEDSLSDKSEPSQLGSDPPKSLSKIASEYESASQVAMQTNRYDMSTFTDPTKDVIKASSKVSYNNEYSLSRNNFFPNHYNMQHNQQLKQHHNAYPLSSQPPIPKFIAPKEHKSEKVRGNDSNNSQESSYIGYSMLQPRPFQCEYCGDRFAHRHSLKRHVRRHLGIGIPCHDCGKLYRDQSEWRRHQLNIHNRRYEKYEVPSRMSFRDGLDQGLIGVVPTTNGTHQHQPLEETDSDRSEEDNPTAAINDTSNKHTLLSSNVPTNISTNVPTHADDVITNNKSVAIFKHEEQKEEEEKDIKLKLFDFKPQVTHDKDSRKSVLDSYLCSADEEGDAAVKTHM